MGEASSLKRPDWLEANQVVDIYSVSNCNSRDFADYNQYTGSITDFGFLTRQKSFWLHWSKVENTIDIGDTQLFFYEVYDS